MSAVANKLEALRKGEITDCVFLIGRDEQMFFACKFDLITSSEYFAGLLRSSLTPPGPIRIKHVQPNIFQMILEYVHTGKIVTPVMGLEDCIQLASAADEFLMPDIGQKCADMLLEKEFLTVENVWKCFNNHHQIRYVASACEKLLCAKTAECLENLNLLGIYSSDVISKFLTFKEMSISSEKVLITLCMECIRAYVDPGEPEQMRIDFFRQNFLPHLRLLTLKADDLAEVAPYLTLDEKVYLLTNLNQRDPLLAHEELPATTSFSLCKIKEPRNAGMVPNVERIFALFSQNDFLDLETMFREGRYLTLMKSTKFALSFTVEHCVRISGFEIFCSVDIKNDYFKKDLMESFRQQKEKIVKPNRLVHNASVKVDHKGYWKEIGMLQEDHIFILNSSVCFETSICLPKGAEVTFEFDLKAGSCIRDFDQE